MAPKYSADELLAHLRELAATLDRSPTAAEMNERGEFSADTYKRRFGSWNAALREADLAVNRQRGIAIDDLLAEIDALTEELDRVPLAVDMREHGRYSLDPYRDRFDSWGDALAAAGFGVRRAEPDAASNVDHLRAGGPCPVARLPDGPLDTTDKMRGAAKFDVGGTGPGSSTPVAYLLDEHDETDVVRTFLDANPALREREAKHNLVQLFGTQGRSWRAAARTVLDAGDA